MCRLLCALGAGRVAVRLVGKGLPIAAVVAVVARL